MEQGKSREMPKITTDVPVASETSRSQLSANQLERIGPLVEFFGDVLDHMGTYDDAVKAFEREIYPEKKMKKLESAALVVSHEIRKRASFGIDTNKRYFCAAIFRIMRLGGKEVEKILFHTLDHNALNCRQCQGGSIASTYINFIKEKRLENTIWNEAEAKEMAGVDSEFKRTCSNCCFQSRKNKKCGVCKKVFYCSKQCQIAHWKVHKSCCTKPK